MINRALEIHVATILLGYVILALAFCASVAYLAQDFMLHGKRFISFSKRLPSLSTLDLLTNRLVAMGFVLMSIGIVFGTIWAERQWGQGWIWDPKIIGAVLVWLIYAIYIYSRTLSGWKGRRSVLLIIIGFVLILITFLGTNFIPGRHRFVRENRDTPHLYGVYDWIPAFAGMTGGVLKPGSIFLA